MASGSKIINLTVVRAWKNSNPKKLPDNADLDTIKRGKTWDLHNIWENWSRIYNCNELISSCKNRKRTKHDIDIISEETFVLGEFQNGQKCWFHWFMYKKHHTWNQSSLKPDIWSLLIKIKIINTGKNINNCKYREYRRLIG